MARKKKSIPVIERVTISDVAAEGKSLVRLYRTPDGSYSQTNPGDGAADVQAPIVVFVPFCVPGDIVDLQITRKKHSYAEARVVKFHQLSPVRATPPCAHFGICGGCKWQNLPYEEQLKAKQQQVYDQLTRIGHLELPPFALRASEKQKVESEKLKVENLTPLNAKPSTLNAKHSTLNAKPLFYNILGSEKIYEYRNKLEFGFSNKRWLTMEEVKSGKEYDNMNACGFHITGAFDKIYPISKCWLMDDLHNRIRNAIYDYAIDHGLSFFDLRNQHGLLRDLMIRNSNSGEWMVLMQFCYDHSSKEKLRDSEEKAKALLQFVADKFPEISSLMYVDNQKCNDTFGDLDLMVFKGNDHIFEHMEDLRFKVGPKSFYQTNTEQALHLYEVAREFAVPLHLPTTGGSASSSVQAGMEASPCEGALVYDLYTGTGTIANFVAKRAGKVIGIEYVPEAIEDAKVNSQINGIDNTEFFAGDMKDILTEEFIAEHGRPDIIITDPPRAGMHPDVVNVILKTHPQRIVYVSCNPATQARDLQMLCTDYSIAAVQPVDMFPHTPHVENVVLLTAKDK